MPWIKDEFYYTVGTLKAVADWYDTVNSYDAYSNIYEVMMIGDHQIVNQWSLMEFKADFDIALDSIGRGEWDGLTSSDFGDYKQLGKQQRVVIADIIGVPDYQLESWGFYDIPQLRGNAYGRMLSFLNEKSFVPNYVRS